MNIDLIISLFSELKKVSPKTLEGYFPLIKALSTELAKVEPSNISKEYQIDFIKAKSKINGYASTSYGESSYLYEIANIGKIITKCLDNSFIGNRQDNQDKVTIKKKIFISYSSKNKNKLEILKREIGKCNILESIVIAQRREPSIPLTMKVAEGIIIADYFLPIITKQSIDNQWVNQEIGFAFALNKKIVPIIENSILDDLKGFIHKNVDLPYIFQFDDTNKFRESSKFRICCKKLVDDLSEKESHLSKSEELKGTKPSDTNIKVREISVIDQATELGKKILWVSEKTKYLKTDEAFVDANKEVENLYDEFKSIVDESNEKAGTRFFDYERENKVDNRIIIYSSNYSLFIQWSTLYNSLEHSFLYLSLYEGYLCLNNISQEINILQPLIKKMKHSYGIGNNFNEKGWLTDSKIFYTSKLFAENWVQSLVNYANEYLKRKNLF